MLQNVDERGNKVPFILNQILPAMDSGDSRSEARLCAHFEFLNCILSAWNFLFLFREIIKNEFQLY